MNEKIKKVDTIKFLSEDVEYTTSDLIEITKDGIYYPFLVDEDSSIIKSFISNEKLKQIKEKLNEL